MCERETDPSFLILTHTSPLLRRWCKTIVGNNECRAPSPIMVLGGRTGVGTTLSSLSHVTSVPTQESFESRSSRTQEGQGAKKSKKELKKSQNSPKIDYDSCSTRLLTSGKSQRVKTQRAKTSENFGEEKHVRRRYFRRFLRR